MNIVEIDGVGDNEEFIVHYLCSAQEECCCDFWLLVTVYTLKAVGKSISILTVVKAGPSNRSQIHSHWRKL